MGTRQAFRPRQLDLSKPLLIVKDVKELDGSADGVLRATPLGGDATKEPEAVQAKKPAKEIPVPDIGLVESYYRDYLPMFMPPPTYIHGKGGTGYRNEDVVEYDLDNEDEDWLAQYNVGGTKLPADKFERLLYKLELACADATENSLSMAGASLMERNTPSALSTTDHLTRQEALDFLKKEVGGRDKVLQDVHDYWRAKRAAWNKPILRRLQAPTSSNDTNPFNVFRPREKVNRPQTRRRRDNTEECLEKLRTIRENLTAAQAIVDQVCRRERRKRDIMTADLHLLRVQVACKLEPNKQLHKDIHNKGYTDLMGQYRVHHAADHNRMGRELVQGPNGQLTYAGTPANPSKKRRLHYELQPFLRQLLPQVQPQPMLADQEMPITLQPDAARLAAEAAAAPGASSAAATAAAAQGAAADKAAASSSNAAADGAGPSAPAAADGAADGPEPFLQLPGKRIRDGAPLPLELAGWRPRVGRHARLWLDRTNQATGEALAETQQQQQQQQQQRQQQQGQQRQPEWPEVPMFSHAFLREEVERTIAVARRIGTGRAVQMQQPQVSQQHQHQQQHQQGQQQAPGVRLPGSSTHVVRPGNGAVSGAFGSVISGSGAGTPSSTGALPSPGALMQPQQQLGAFDAGGAGTPRGQSPMLQHQGSAGLLAFAARTPAVRTDSGLQPPQPQSSGPMQLTMKRGPGRPPKSGMKVAGQANGGTPGLE